MKKILIILLLISPIHTSQALSLTDIVNWAKPLMPWYETQPELRSVLQDLGIGARDLIRKGESVYKDLQLSNKSLTEDELIKAMLNYPILIERPIVRTTKGIVIGRPPENVQSIL